MLAETIAYRNVYIICGYTDMRKSINGLVAILTQQYQIKPDAESLYLFCGKRADRMKAILCQSSRAVFGRPMRAETTSNLVLFSAFIRAIHVQISK